MKNLWQNLWLTVPGLTGIFLFSEISLSTLNRTQAQILPDNTLGSESSVLMPGDVRDLIEGGATRGSALFHSFEEFNVNTGQQVYFANPIGIENILSRVTGFNPSQIDGLLGVDGMANLFFLNPNGIVFGPDAQLDVQGAFVASTSDRFQFADGSEFRATDPNDAPLVTVNIPLGLQLGPDAPAALVSEADLETGTDLRLSAGSVTSTGLLSAPNGEVRVEGVAGDVQVQAVEAQSAVLLASKTLQLEESQLQTTEDLTLQASDTVYIRDSAEDAFMAVSGGDLTIQGNQGIDILALNHTETPFQSGGNLTLISDEIISGDAHFQSLGNLSIQDLAGNAGEFISLYDPIFRSNSDVDFGNYTGVSLKVEAVGTISGGNIRINGPDSSIPNADPDFDVLTTAPALILRAGLLDLDINLPNVPTDPPPEAGGTPFDDISSSLLPTGSIEVNSISSFDPIADERGSVELFSRTGDIRINGEIPGDNPGFSIAAGSITIDASGEVSAFGALTVRRDDDQPAGNIEIGQSSIITPTGVTVGSLSTRQGGTSNGGNISVSTTGIFEVTGAFNREEGSISEPNIENAPGFPEISDVFASIATQAINGNGGRIEIDADGGITVPAEIVSANDILGLGDSMMNEDGDGGVISLTSDGGFIDVGNIRSFTRGDNGRSGRVTIDAATQITLRDVITTSEIGDGGFDTSGDIIVTSIGGGIEVLGDLDSSTTSGDSGDIELEASGSILIDASGGAPRQVRSTSEEGNSDAIFFSSDESVILRNVSIRTETSGSDDGNLGDVTIEAPNIEITDGSRIQTDTFNSQIVSPNEGNDAGDVRIGTRLDNSLNSSILINDAFIRTRTFGFHELGEMPGNAGNIIIGNEDGSAEYEQLTIQNSSITATSRIGAFEDIAGKTFGNAGAITISASDDDPQSLGDDSPLTIDGNVSIINSIVSTSVDNAEIAGDINVLGATVDVTNSTVVSDNPGRVSGNAGAIQILSTGDTDDDVAEINVSGSRVLATTSGEANAGRINFSAYNSGDLTIERSSNVSSSTFGEGNSQDVNLSGQRISVTEGSTVQALSRGEGAPGSIFVNASQNLQISGFNSIGQVSELSTFSGPAAELDNVIDCAIGCIEVQAGDIELTNRGRISAVTQTLDDSQVGGSIKVDARSISIIDGGQILTSSISETGAQAGNIQIEIEEDIEISGSANAFSDESNFQNAIVLNTLGNVVVTTNPSGIEEILLTTGSGSVNASELESSLNLTFTEIDPPNYDVEGEPGDQLIREGSAIQFDLSNSSNSIVLGGQFLTDQSTEMSNFFNDFSFIAQGSQSPQALADTCAIISDCDGFNESLAFDEEINLPDQEFLPGSISNILGVVDVGNTGVDSAILVDDISTDGSILLSDPVVDPNDTFLSGIFAESQGADSGSISVEFTGQNSDLLLQESAQISTSTISGDGGDVSVTGLQTLIIENSLISTSTETGIAGDINVDAADAVNLSGTLFGEPGGINASAGNATIDGGMGGNIKITTTQLAVQDGAEIAASAIGTADAGFITIDSTDVALNNGSQIETRTVEGNADANGIQLQNLQTLSVTDSQISASTQSGEAGGITIDATDSVILSGMFDNDSGGISASAGDGGTGGSLQLNTSELTIQNGAEVAASAEGTGNAGFIVVDANTIALNNEGQITAETEAGTTATNASTENTDAIRLGNLQTLTVTDSRISASTTSGRAGGVTVNASDSILLSGAFGNEAAGVSAAATDGGTAGSVTLNTNDFRVDNGAAATVSSPDGEAGSLTVTATRVTLDRGFLTAVAGLGQGGADINLDLSQDPSLTNFVRLRNESLISANAQGDATGGNIAIKADFIFGEYPTGSEGSDIIANAQLGNGGMITINAPLGVFGLQFRSERTPLNDITANSQQGAAGTVAVNTLAVDPTSGLAELAFEFIDASDQTTNQCTVSSSGESSEITIAGRGGLPPMPTAVLGANIPDTADWVTLDETPSDESPDETSSQEMPGVLAVDEDIAVVAPLNRQQVLCHRAYQRQQQGL